MRTNALTHLKPISLPTSTITNDPPTVVTESTKWKTVPHFQSLQNWHDKLHTQNTAHLKSFWMMETNIPLPAKNPIFIPCPTLFKKGLHLKCWPLSSFPPLLRMS